MIGLLVAVVLSGAPHRVAVEPAVRRVCDAFEVPGADWTCPKPLTQSVAIASSQRKPPAVISAAPKWTAPVVPHQMVLVSDGILLEQTRQGPGRCPTWHLQ